MVAAKVIDADTAAEWAHKNLVAPEVVEKLHAFWLKPATTAQKEASAADLLALYDGEKATRAETLAALEALGYPADEAAAKLDVLDARRVTSARNAAISDLHAAFKKGSLTSAMVAPALAKLVNEPGSATQILAAWQAYKDAFPPPAPAVVPPVA
jgi:predicted nucleotidyltransferase